MASSKRKKQPPATVGTKATVLVADDDADYRNMLATILTDDGYKVIESENGTQALEYLLEAADGKHARPDVLLLDFCMPGLSGIGLLQVLRRFARVPPTVLVTAFPDKSVEVFARNAGAARVLWKPLKAEDVRAAVGAALKAASVTS